MSAFDDQENHAARRARRPEITPWKRILLALAGLAVVAGAVLRAGGSTAPETGETGSAAARPGGSTLVGQGSGGFQLPSLPGSQPEAPRATPSAGASEWSPFLLKGGFSFFIAFCVGYAMRVWLKISFLVIGTFFLGVFVLSYFGALNVKWETVQGWYDKVAAHVRDNASDFRTFLTGSLPQAGLASLGLVTGFKRR